MINFPTMHVLCRLCSRPPNDFLTTCHDFLTLHPRLLSIPNHSRLFCIVQNSWEQSRTHRSSLPTSQDLLRPIPVLSRLPHDFIRPSQDHQGRERSAFMSAKYDRGFMVIGYKPGNVSKHMIYVLHWLWSDQRNKYAIYDSRSKGMNSINITVFHHIFHVHDFRYKLFRLLTA